MTDLTSRAWAEEIGRLRKERDDAVRMLGAVLLAVGDAVCVRGSVLENIPAATIYKSKAGNGDGFIFRARLDAPDRIERLRDSYGPQEPYNPVDRLADLGRALHK